MLRRANEFGWKQLARLDEGAGFAGPGAGECGDQLFRTAAPVRCGEPRMPHLTPRTVRVLGRDNRCLRLHPPLHLCERALREQQFRVGQGASRDGRERHRQITQPGEGVGE